MGSALLRVVFVGVVTSGCEVIVRPIFIVIRGVVVLVRGIGSTPQRHRLSEEQKAAKAAVLKPYQFIAGVKRPKAAPSGDDLTG